ncbi:sulfotransferase family 2 domain-containing protein [Vibrio cyclitrophicus]
MIKIKSIYTRIPLLIRLNIHNKLSNPYSKYQNENKVIFVHIPKAAGNSVTKSLFGVKSTGHFTITNFFIKNPYKFYTYYKFCISRNPYSRFISAFEYLKEGGMSKTDREFYELYLNEFSSIQDFAQLLVDDYQFREKILSWTHFIPQYKFLLLFGRYRILDNIYKVEELESCINTISSELNLNVKKLVHENKTGNRSITIDEKLINAINIIYKRDFELLNYEKL